MIEHHAGVPPADRDAIADLWVRAWEATLPQIDFAARRDWLLAHLDRLTAGGAILLLLREDGTATGVLTLHGGTGEIDQLAVDPSRAGMGLGRQLLEEAKRLAPPGGLRLTVNTDNHRALRVYGDAGFVPTGEGVNLRSGLPVRHMAWWPDAAR